MIICFVPDEKLKPGGFSPDVLRFAAAVCVSGGGMIIFQPESKAESLSDPHLDDDLDF